MMDVSDPDVLACIDNYHVRLIAPVQMTDEEIMKFQSSLREVMLFIKYSKNKENLSRISKANEKRFREVERRAVDVCQVIQEMKMAKRRIGEQHGEWKKAKETATKLYEIGIDTEQIAHVVVYAVKIVKGWLGLQ